MKKIICFVLFFVAWQLVKSYLRQDEGFDEIEYQGEHFALSQKYDDYEDYKKSDDQLSTHEVQRVKNIMLSIPAPKDLGSWEELNRLHSDIRFPGYGSSHQGVKDEQGLIYDLSEFEIPQTGQQRSLLYRIDKDGTCHCVVDGLTEENENDHNLFVHDKVSVKIENRILRHYLSGKPYREIAYNIEPSASMLPVAVIGDKASKPVVGREKLFGLKDNEACATTTASRGHSGCPG